MAQGWEHSSGFALQVERRAGSFLGRKLVPDKLGSNHHSPAVGLGLRNCTCLSASLYP